MPAPAALAEFTPHFADPENARQAGLKRAEMAKQEHQELENLRLIISTKPLEQIHQPQAPNLASIEVEQQLALTEEQIAHVRAILNDTKQHYCEHCERGGLDGKERAALLRELRGLLELRLDLRGIPKPAHAKAQAPKAVKAARAEPIALPQPASNSVQPPTPSSESPK